VEDPNVPDIPTGGAAPGMPRWVKVSALVTGVLVLAIVLMLVLGGGDHGPGRHMGGPGSHGRAASSWTTP
jgi:hypothetical protein